MFGKKSLKGRRIAVLATDGFEKVELTVPVAALRNAGAVVEIVSLQHGNIRGMNLHEPAGRVKVDHTIAEVNASQYDGLLIPGGFINPDLLRQSAAVRDFVRAFDEARKPIATLCHGPWVLASARLLEGRTLTSWPGIRDDLVNAGATWIDEEVVRDSNWVSSRGPQDLTAFVSAMIDLFALTGPITVSHAQYAASSPQPESPPALAAGVVHWAPRPSLRTLFGLAAVVGAGVLAAKKQRAAPNIGS
jgi:protease I